MALTFTTGMTPIATADETTNWLSAQHTGTWKVAPARIQNSGASAHDCAQGSYSWGGASWTANAKLSIMYDYYTAQTPDASLNMTTAGNEVFAVWVGVLEPACYVNLSAGGIFLIVNSDTGTTTFTNCSLWYVSGRDVLISVRTQKSSWYLFMIDTRKTPSATLGSGATLSAVTKLGAGHLNQASPPQPQGDPPPVNFFVDAMWYGRPIYSVIGDGSTVATWADFVTNSWTTNQNGLIQDLGAGIYECSCGLRIGSDSQTATTTFSDATNKTIIFKRQTYYYGGVVDALNYSDYYIVEARGAASYKTSVTLGAVVGSGDTRKGRGGGTFITGDLTNVTFKADFATDIAHLSNVKLYGVYFYGAKGGIKFDDNSYSTIISNTFERSGEVDCGTTNNGAYLLNCTIIDPEGGTAQNYGLTLRQNHNIKNIDFITSGTPSTQHMINLPTSGTYSISMDKLTFYGDYSSGTLWHGDLSNATLSTVTANALNGANPSASEFSKTGNGSSTITINNSVTLKVTVKDAAGNVIQDAQTAIYKASDDTELMNKDTDSGGIADTTFNYSSDTNVYIRVRKSTTGSTRYLSHGSNGVITSSGLNVVVTLYTEPLS